MWPCQFPVLEKIEADNVSVQRERLNMVTKRRFEDDSDDVATFTGTPVPTDFTKVGHDDVGMDADGGEGVDELGRTKREHDLAPGSHARRMRREDRKKRRMRITGPGSGADADAAEDGYETDDMLLPADAADLISARGAISQELSALFADVQAAEFRDPLLGVRPRFQSWMAAYPDEYANAFGGLAMVGVWEFWARAELAFWNPFGVSELATDASGSGATSKSLDQWSWHQALSEFQHAEQGEEDTVAHMVATVVLPRLRKLAVEAFDPFSSRATARALEAVEEITYCLDPSHPRFEVSEQAPSLANSSCCWGCDLTLACTLPSPRSAVPGNELHRAVSARCLPAALADRASAERGTAALVVRRHGRNRRSPAIPAALPEAVDEWPPLAQVCQGHPAPCWTGVRGSGLRHGQ